MVCADRDRQALGGGLPGKRTTPIVVAIVASHGLVMPKTSSRAITSPAGTADTMETLAPVDLDLAAMRRAVEQEGACLVWGGSVRLSPADDILIRVERVLDIDAQGQLIASVLSKKIAAGSTHIVIDIPVGATAKVRTDDAAAELADQLTEVGRVFGVTVRCVITDGAQPVGRGIGPALEARDVLAALQGLPDAPNDHHPARRADGGWLPRRRRDHAPGMRSFDPRCHHRGGGLGVRPCGLRRRPRGVAVDGRRRGLTFVLLMTPEPFAAKADAHDEAGDDAPRC